LNYKRSLYVIKDIKAGERFTSENIKSIRPGYGLDPDTLNEILERYAYRDLPKGTPLKEEDVIWTML